MAVRQMQMGMRGKRAAWTLGAAAWLAPVALLAGQAPAAGHADPVRVDQIIGAASVRAARAEGLAAAAADPSVTPPGGLVPGAAAPLVPGGEPTAAPGAASTTLSPLAPGLMILQSGNGNQAQIEQSGEALALETTGRVRIEQSGEANQAVLLQTGPGNDAVQIQMGSHNALSLEQHGPVQGAVQIQVGSGLEQHVEQIGGWGTPPAGAAITITQTQP